MKLTNISDLVIEPYPLTILITWFILLRWWCILKLRNLRKLMYWIFSFLQNRLNLLVLVFFPHKTESPKLAQIDPTYPIFLKKTSSLLLTPVNPINPMPYYPFSQILLPIISLFLHQKLSPRTIPFIHLWKNQSINYSKAKSNSLRVCLGFILLNFFI